jgi:hypothetical protein
VSFFFLLLSFLRCLLSISSLPPFFLPLLILFFLLSSFLSYSSSSHYVPSILPFTISFFFLNSNSDSQEEAEEGIVLADLSVGVVSVGDVLLNNLKQHIEAAGITVEFRLTASGGVLVCGSQVSVPLYALHSAIFFSYVVPSCYRRQLPFLASDNLTLLFSLALPSFSSFQQYFLSSYFLYSLPYTILPTVHSLSIILVSEFLSHFLPTLIPITLCIIHR